MKFLLQNLIARFKTAGLAGNALHRLFSLTRPDHNITYAFSFTSTLTLIATLLHHRLAVR
jgi:hypothetical protein